MAKYMCLGNFGECFIFFSSESLAFRVTTNSVKIKIHKATSLLVVLCGCETLPHVLKEDLYGGCLKKVAKGNIWKCEG